MSSDSRVIVRWPVLALAAVLLLAAGAALAYFVLRSRVAPISVADNPASMNATPPAPASPAMDTQASATGLLPDVVITLAPEAIERAGITVTPVIAGSVSGGLRAPGVVEANAYKQVAVTSLVSGRLTRVAAELGQHVRRGQTIAQVFSPELAEAQTRYISARAELGADEQEVVRTETLVAIGAASKQELERIQAEHAARRAEVQSLASRLQLLGLSSRTIADLGPDKVVDATTNVPAPIDGVITKRDANVGANIDQSTPLFTIVDLSTVWIVADVFEKDFAQVRVGSPATVTTNAYPDLSVRGRVSYVDPQVNVETRTAKVRVEVPNPRQQLRLGMYADVAFTGEGGSLTPTIPRSAVQNVGDRTVVYLAQQNERGKFVEREVRLGPSAGDRIAVLSGVTLADTVVAEGSFFVRAERERLGLRPSTAADTNRDSGRTNIGIQDLTVTVTESGFEPQRITLKTGLLARLTFTRTSDKTCATKVVFPSLKIERDLPLNKPVTVEFTPAKPGDVEFVCGMNMRRGSVVIQ